MSDYRTCRIDADIVIIDSGLDKTLQLNENIIGGVRICVDDEENAVISENFDDLFGHGTAIYSIINNNCDAKYYIIKIFDDSKAKNIYIKENNINCKFDKEILIDKIKPKDMDFSSVTNFSDLFLRSSRTISVSDLITLLKMKNIVSLADLNYTIGNRKIQIADATELSVVNDYIKTLQVPQGGFRNPVTQAVLKKFSLPNGMTLYEVEAKLINAKNIIDQATPNTQAVNQVPSPTPNVTPNQTVQTPQASNNTNNQNNPNAQLNGRQVDTGKMWSPQSGAGVVYEFNRGVYGIGADKFYRKNIDRTSLHHADQTSSIILEDTGIDKEFDNPFEAAVSAVGYGIVIVQLEGSECFIYLPNSVENILRPRNGFHFLVYKDGLTYDDKDNGEDLNLDDVFNLVGTALENADALSNKLA